MRETVREEHKGEGARGKEGGVGWLERGKGEREGGRDKMI
jgi:hypothetical protein